MLEQIKPLAASVAIEAEEAVVTTSKAMVDGSQPLEVSEALMIALSGFLVVFFVLGALAVMIKLIAQVVGSIEAKMPQAPVVAPAPKAPAPQEDEELVAVLMAAIAEETQCDIGSFQITSVVEKN